MTAALKVLRAHCPKCRAERKASVEAEVVRPWEDSENHTNGQIDYRVLECGGCETLYFQIEEVSTDHHETCRDPETDDYVTPEHRKVTLYPSPSRRHRPEWADSIGLNDDTLSQLLKETYTALDSDLRVLAAVGARTTFDRATEVLEIDPAITFDEKLAVLFQVGEIGQGERETLSTLTDAGNAAAHRGWRPTGHELDLIMSVLEGFLHRSFMLKGAMERLKRKIPPKQKRKTTRKGGRPPALSPNDLETAKELLSDPKITVEEVAARLKIAPSTLYRHFPGGRSSL